MGISAISITLSEIKLLFATMVLGMKVRAIQFVCGAGRCPMTKFKVGDRIRRTRRDEYFGVERTVLGTHPVDGHAVVAAPEDLTHTDYSIYDDSWN
jgi:hypothetical protein